MWSKITPHLPPDMGLSYKQYLATACQACEIHKQIKQQMQINNGYVYILQNHSRGTTWASSLLFQDSTIIYTQGIATITTNSQGSPFHQRAVKKVFWSHELLLAASKTSCTSFISWHSFKGLNYIQKLLTLLGTPVHLYSRADTLSANHVAVKCKR